MKDNMEHSDDVLNVNVSGVKRTLYNVVVGPNMIVRLEIATRKDPFKWIMDQQGYKTHLPLAISRTSHKERHGVVWSIIIGPIVYILGFISP